MKLSNLLGKSVLEPNQSGCVSHYDIPLPQMLVGRMMAA